MLIHREKHLSRIKNSISKVPITILIGARQTGKTSLIESLLLDMDTFKLDGETVETNNLFSSIPNVVEFLKIKINKDLEGLLIIDEFQFIDKISTKLKILIDSNKKLKILCSGSSSLDIVQTVEESLAGRVRMLSVNSLSFSESVLFNNKELFNEYEKYSVNTNDDIVSPQIKLILNNNLVYGGMPRVALESDPIEKIQILNDIYRTYLLRDVKSYVRNKDSVGFNKLLQFLALQISNLINVNELSRVTSLSYNKCEEYIYILEQMFIIKLVEPFENNQRKAIKKRKKIFFMDLGLRNIIINNFNSLDIRIDNGALFENFIFLEIFKHTLSYYKINFYRTRDGAEVDFVINDMMKNISIEAKYKNLNKPLFLKALLSFNLSENIAESYVVNLTLNQKHNNIKYIQSYLLNKIFTE